MTANEAKKLSRKYKDPKDLASAKLHITKFSMLGFTNCAFIFKGKAKSAAIAKSLEADGFAVWLRPHELQEGYYFMDLEWSR